MQGIVTAWPRLPHKSRVREAFGAPPPRKMPAATAWRAPRVDEQNSVGAIVAVRVIANILVRAMGRLADAAGSRRDALFQLAIVAEGLITLRTAGLSIRLGIGSGAEGDRKCGGEA